MLKFGTTAPIPAPDSAITSIPRAACRSVRKPASPSRTSMKSDFFLLTAGGASGSRTQAHVAKFVSSISAATM